MTDIIPLRDRLIPWYFVLFFVGLSIVYGTMVTIAFNTMPGIVTENPYEKGIAYNQTIKNAEEQAKLNWYGDIKYKSTSRQAGIVSFTLKDSSGVPINSDSVSVNITRPIKSGMDFDIELNPINNFGSFQAAVSFPVQGLWELRFFAEAKGKTYQQSTRINVE